MKQVLIVGAGMLGKGFIGETFDAAPGWQISFLDNDPRVIENLNKGDGYNVLCCRHDRTDHRHITDYKAYLTDDALSCAADAIACEVIMMPLYPHDFPAACAYLGKVLSLRAAQNPDKPLDIVCNTNFNHYIPSIEQMFLDGLASDEAREWFKAQVYVRDSIIRRSTIADSNYALDLRSGVVASLLIQSPLHYDLSDVEWMEPRDRIELLKDMKIYTINSTHATAAYAGYLKGYALADRCFEDEDIMATYREVMEESIHGLTHEFPITREEIEDMCECLTISTETPLEDSVKRVCWDPIRKLGRNDRLTGNAMFCYKYGREPEGLTLTMARAFAYDNPADPAAMKIQALIKNNGIRAAAAEICGLPADHHIIDMVVEKYESLKK